VKKNPDRLKFLPICLKGIRVAFPLVSLEPESIRSALSKVENTYPPNIASNSLLNAFARELGLAPGWAEYRRGYDETLLPFLKENGLTKLRCLLGEDYDRVFILTYRQIADRIFVSGRSQPVRLFTGIGFDYWQLLELALKQSGLTVRMGWEQNSATSPFDRRFPPNSYQIYRGRHSFSFIDVFHFFGNLIGDQLCGDVPNEMSENLALVYQAGPKEARRLEIALSIFRRLVMSSESGWVRVIPFNDKLVFLADEMGGYDFVFRNLRDVAAPSVTSVEDTGRSPAAVDEDEVFQAWSNFHYTGWLEREKHEAEQEFYTGGGTLATYPGITAVLRRYLTRHHKYMSPTEAVHIVAGKVKLTELVTIKEFKVFLGATREIVKARGDDPSLFANGDREEDDNLPVSVNWEEAAAYAKWINDKGHHHVRLPTEDEYRERFAGVIPQQISVQDVKQALSEPLVDFVASDGAKFEGHPPYMSPAAFARLRLRYRVPLRRQDGRVLSAYFGEWLEPKGAAINGRFFCAQFAVEVAHMFTVSPSRARFAVDGTGKYKSMKIGFRLAILD
jgi:Sulfatase-modifying factor enzyme 1